MKRGTTRLVFLPPQLIDKLKSSYLLLDTCVFYDAYRYSRDFTKFFDNLKKQDCDLLTILPVAIEFLRGSATTKEHKSRQDFIKAIAGTVLPIEKTLIEDIQALVSAYRDGGRHTNITDFFLAGVLKRYKNLYLMTGDNKDFPTTIFDREGVVSNDACKEPRFYGIYKFSEEKYSSVLKSLLKINGQAN